MAYVAAAGAVYGAYNQYEQGKKSKAQNSGALQVNQGEVEQASLAHEATYRQDREGLMSAIGSYYHKQGWSLPEAQPGTGTGTGRPLPGDPALYPGYDIPNDTPWNHTQTPPPGTASGAPTVIGPDGTPQPAVAAPSTVPVTNGGQNPQTSTSPDVQSGQGEGTPAMAVGAQPTGSAMAPIQSQVQTTKPQTIVPQQQAQSPQIQQNLQLIASRLGGQYGY